MHYQFHLQRSFGTFRYTAIADEKVDFTRWLLAFMMQVVLNGQWCKDRKARYFNSLSLLQNCLLDKFSHPAPYFIEHFLGFFLDGSNFLGADAGRLLLLFRVRYGREVKLGKLI